MYVNQQFIRQVNCYIAQNVPKYIVIHETDNWNKGAHALAHAKAHYNKNLSTSVHYYVDDGKQGHDAVYQTLLISDGAYAVGKQYGISNNPDANNRNTINIEICVNPETDYTVAVDKCIVLVRELMKNTGIDENHVIRHYDAKRKHCPRRMLDDPEIWTRFKNAIKKDAVSECIVSEYSEVVKVWLFFRIVYHGSIQVSKEALSDQWVKYKNKWFYVGKNGVMVTGFRKIDGKYFYLNESLDDESTYGALMVTPDPNYGELVVCYVD